MKKVANEKADKDDIIVENASREMADLHETTKPIKTSNTTSNTSNYSELTEEEMKRLINSYDPPKIKDWPNRKYKTIAIILLLLFSSVLFLYNGFRNLKDHKTWDQWLSYIVLGIMLFIPGIYYGVILIFILIGKEGYEYKQLPDLSTK